ncbi:MAG: alpha-N-arabinofuranosidase [Planctomycetota bacterium]|nr:alpha-N-arabinofuranosidase [Planctomycetota bacterium]
MSKVPVVILTALLLATGSIWAASVSVTVDPDKVVGHIDERLYGQFLEHIYHSCNGGLWGEVVWNRSFEELPPVKKGEKLPAGAFARHWEIIGDGVVVLSTNQPLNPARFVEIRGTAGVVQKNFCLRGGDTFRGSLWARGDGSLAVKLGDAEQTIPALAADWKEYPLTLSPNSGDTLQIIARGSVCIDQVSLMSDAARATGGFRPDLLAAVAALRPPTIRWPGGSFVSGYKWKHSIGPQHQRISKKGWDELDPLSFGIDEFMSLCRKLGAEPVICVDMGVDKPELVQDACDFIEYCNGPATSKWGAVRAANGHAAPYRVKYWEIGNEVWRLKPDAYVGVVKQFAPAMKKADPAIQLIACGSGQLGGHWREGDIAVIEQCAELVDYLSIHHYETPENFAEGPAAAEQFWQTLAARIAQSKNPKLRIYFSEWNTRSSIDWRNGLYAGGILNALERNQITTMACPALWLRHVSAPDWDNAFINFDAGGWFSAPNYVVMKLWHDYLAPNRLALEGDPGPLNVIAAKGDSLTLKAVNPSTSAVPVELTVKPGFTIGNAEFMLINPGSLQARNSLTEPNQIHPVPADVKLDGQTVHFTMPPLSAGVITLKERNK